MAAPRGVARKVPESESERCVSEGVDVLIKRSPGAGKVPVKQVASFMKDNSLSLLASDKEGGFLVLPVDLYKVKAREAISSVFQSKTDISLEKKGRIAPRDLGAEDTQKKHNLEDSFCRCCASGLPRHKSDICKARGHRHRKREDATARVRGASAISTQIHSLNERDVMDQDPQDRVVWIVAVGSFSRGVLALVDRS
ncbi:hypothetical protein HPB47_010254 [Ixodes persulcatus]|uniref:Uncharacterized protein n=1 Tax=Ixodes persulcatus TaxID=34615 RepID=A0AC60NZL6_IXOPE|nr:hypothetical protein HPB47_010254 [Ixodes persulcatus]